MTQQVMRDVLPTIPHVIAPIKEFAAGLAQERDQVRGQRQFQALNTAVPDWQAFVDPRQLAEAINLQARDPKPLPAASAFKVLGFDALYAEHQKLKSQVAKMMGRTPPPNQHGTAGLRVARPRDGRRTRWAMRSTTRWNGSS